MKGYRRYYYDGPVFSFNTCVTEHWQGETMAPSENKARSNLIYQFKTSNGLGASSRINLPNKLTLID